MSESRVKNVVEAALLAAGRSLPAAELVGLFEAASAPSEEDVRAALARLQAEYLDRGIEIKETAAGFRVQVRQELATEISRLWSERPPRFSRALLETLALIAYRQPITRGEIEAVRGVAVNPNIIKTLLERNWVRVAGHRDVPGRPELLGTTREFLDYFGLRSLDELPPLAELRTLGELHVQLDLGSAERSAPSQDSTEAGAPQLPAAAPEGRGDLSAAAEAQDLDELSEGDDEEEEADSEEPQAGLVAAARQVPS
jgi:segregation and condensation protein B